MLYIKQYTDDSGEMTTISKIVDDKNIDKDTLSLRRLELLKQGVELKKLSMAIFFLGDLIKLATRKTWFIDSYGNLFQYKKDKNYTLIFRRINLQINIPSGGSILEVDGIPSRFKCLYSPAPDEKIAGILQKGKSYILYGIYKQEHKNTRRMV